MAANEAKIVITAADQASKKLDGITEKARGMRTAFLAIGAATTAIGVVSVKAASDLEESAQAAEVTFKSAFQSVDQFANGAAGAFNLSRRAAFEYTAQLGGIFNASGLAAQASANMSIEATKLAADLASFKNLEIDVALQKIRAGLVGEVEPLRTVGVLLSAAAVEAKAMALGLQDANGELSEGAKVQARFALITEQLSDAQGDVARTSESVANQTREMQKNMENLRAEIGEKLLPVTSDLLGKMNDLAVALENVPSSAMTATVALGGLVTGITILGAATPHFTRGISLLSRFAGVLGTIVSAPVTLGLTAFAAGIGVVSVGMKDLESDVAEANKALHAFDGELKTISEQEKYDAILEQIISVEDAFGNFGNSFKDIAAQHAEAFNEIATVTQKTAEVIDLAMTGNIAMFENVKKADVELARFKNDNGRLINDNARDAAEEAETIALENAQSIVEASEERWRKIAEGRERDLAHDLEFLQKRSDAVEALKAANLEAFAAIRSEVEALPSVIPAAGAIGDPEAQAGRARVFNLFKQSQQRVEDQLAAAQARLASGEVGGGTTRAMLQGEVDRLLGITQSEQFRGERLGQLFAPPGGFGTGAPPTLAGQVYGQGVPGVTVVVEGSVVAEDLPSIVEKGLQELANQGAGYVGGAKFEEETLWH